MTPDILLRKILSDACLNQLPLLRIREQEHSLWSAWEKRKSSREIGNLRRMETRTGRPMGPAGFWTWRKYEFGCWYRPHRVDEVVVDWMSSAFYPDYVMVLSSGPFGGLYLVYRNEKFLMLEEELPFDDKKGMLEWMQRFSNSGTSS